MEAATADLHQRRSDAGDLIKAATEGKHLGEQLAAKREERGRVADLVGRSRGLRRSAKVLAELGTTWTADNAEVVADALANLTAVHDSNKRMLPETLRLMDLFAEPWRAMAAWATVSAMASGLPKPRPTELMLLAVTAGVETPTSDPDEPATRLDRWDKRAKSILSSLQAALADPRSKR